MNRSEMLRRLQSGEDVLEVSIQKWQDIVDGKGKNLGSENCALCETNPKCDSCVIHLAKGGLCSDTPYGEYVDATTPNVRHYAALRELEFLKSLRKKEA